MLRCGQEGIGVDSYRQVGTSMAGWAGRDKCQQVETGIDRCEQRCVCTGKCEQA
jgi:hypothetical protein